MRTALLACVLIAGVFSTAVVSAQEEEWGHLTGTFIYDGDIPDTQWLNVRRGGAVRDESLQVGEMGGLKNVVVTMHRAAGAPAPAVHPSYDAAAGVGQSLAFVNNQFSPHVVLLRTTQSLAVTNRDAVGRNLKIACIENPPVNPFLAPAAAMDFVFGERESRPIRMSSSIHPWMSGALVVQDHPYMAVTDARGAFTIHNLPTGAWTFQFWHEKAGALERVKLNGVATVWDGGVATVPIAAGANNLGTVRLAPKLFK